MSCYDHQFNQVTGLASDELFQDILKKAISRANRYQRIMALMIISINNLNTIENNYSPHTNGLLKLIGRRLVSCVRESDTVAHFNDNTFAVLFDEIKHLNETHVLASKVLSKLKEHFCIGDSNIEIHCSVGIACYPAAGDNSATLMDHATQALIDAKNKGNDTYQTFNGMQGNQNRQQQIETELKLALERNQFSLVYQPRYELQNQKISAIEVFVRWNHPKLKNISPDQFIPVAERLGLMAKIGQWVLDHALAELMKKHEYWPPNLKIVYNLSNVELLEKHCVENILSTLEKHGVSPHCLEIDCREDFIVSHFDQAKKVLTQLSQNGIMIMLDDYGCGYSNIPSLNELPISAIKINHSVIKKLTEQKDRRILRSIIQFAKNLGLGIIAESIETEQELSILKDEGCFQGSGHFFSPPLEIQKLVKLLKQTNHNELISKKHQKTLQDIFQDPITGNIPWNNIEKLLISIGTEMKYGRGSRIHASYNGAHETFHKPHPSNQASKATIKTVRKFLEKAGVKPLI